MKSYMLRSMLPVGLTVLVAIVISRSVMASDIMIIPSPPLPVAPLVPKYSADALSGDGLIVAGKITNYLVAEDEYGAYDYIGLFCWTREDGFNVFYEAAGPSFLNYEVTELGYDGTAVGYSHDLFSMSGIFRTSFRYPWSPAQQTGPVDIEWLDAPPGYPDEEDFAGNHWASDVSSDGKFVVGLWGYYIGGYDGVFNWKEDIGPARILAPGNSVVESLGAPAVSGDGQTIVANCSNHGDSASVSFFNWTEPGGYKWLGFGMAADISTDGRVIVGEASFSGEAFRYTEADGIELIGSFAPVKTNGDGSLIIGDDRIWDRQNGLQPARDYLVQKGIDLDSDGWIISSVKDVSDDGTVFIGTGRNDSTTREVPWIATITPPPTDEEIIDNRDGGFSRAGIWHASATAVGFYGSDYLYAYGGDGSATATFTFDIPADGNYQIAAQWPAHSSRAPDAPFTLINNGTVVDTVRVNQRIDGGAFNPLVGPGGTGGPGIYTLSAGVLEVTLSNDAAGKVAADAVQVASMGSAGD
jgi:hypothetical protein